MLPGLFERNDHPTITVIQDIKYPHIHNRFEEFYKKNLYGKRINHTPLYEGMPSLSQSIQ